MTQSEMLKLIHDVIRKHESTCEMCWGGREIYCPTCNGEASIPCPDCGGRGGGDVIDSPTAEPRWVECDRCQSLGWIDCTNPACQNGRVPCTRCAATGLDLSDDDLERVNAELAEQGIVISLDRRRRDKAGRYILSNITTFDPDQPLPKIVT